jgi:hypothetical protein
VGSIGQEAGPELLQLHHVFGEFILLVIQVIVLEFKVMPLELQVILLSFFVILLKLQVMLFEL